MAEGSKFLDLANIANRIGFQTFTKKTWLEGGAPYQDPNGKEFFQCLVFDKDDTMGAYIMAFPKARLLTLGFEFRSRTGFEEQLLNMLGQT